VRVAQGKETEEFDGRDFLRACENGQGNRSGVAQMSIRDKG